MARGTGTTPKKAAPVRKVTGQAGQTPVAAGTNTPKGQAAAPTSDENADFAAKQSTTARRPVITASGTSSFQLRSSKRGRDGEPDSPDWTVDFGAAGFIAADDETLDAFEKVLDGTWSDGRTPASVFQQNARMVGIQIRRYDLTSPPITTWDSLSFPLQVEVAKAAGVLATPDQIRAAIRYENESDQRNPKRDVDDRVVQLLEAELVIATQRGQHESPGDVAVSAALARLGSTVAAEAPAGDTEATTSSLTTAPAELG